MPLWDIGWVPAFAGMTGFGGYRDVVPLMDEKGDRKEELSGFITIFGIF